MSTVITDNTTGEEISILDTKGRSYTMTIEEAVIFACSSRMEEANNRKTGLLKTSVSADGHVTFVTKKVTVIECSDNYEEYYQQVYHSSKPFSSIQNFPPPDDRPGAAEERQRQIEKDKSLSICMSAIYCK